VFQNHRRSGIKYICIGADHRGFYLKKKLCTYMYYNRIPYVDLGCYADQAPSDYPDIVVELNKYIESIGILICNTGIGMSIAANKTKKLYAALCINEDMAKSARNHNNANTLIIGAKYTSITELIKMLNIFLKENFLLEERNLRRLKKVKVLEIE